ncbi:MAG: hypothetical protein AB2L20_09410 [Mangrovibacterium sp.]
MACLARFIYIDDQEINRNFDTEIEKLTGGTIGMGVIDVIKRQERLEGKTQTIRNLIIKLDLSDKQIADVAEVPVSFVKKIRVSLKKQA